MLIDTPPHHVMITVVSSYLRMGCMGAMVWNLLHLIRGLSKILPLAPVIYYLRSDMMMWAVDSAVTYLYSEMFYEIPDKLTIEDDNNVYVGVEELNGVFESDGNGELSNPSDY